MKNEDLGTIASRIPICKLCQRFRKLTDEDIVPTWERKHFIIVLGPFPAGQGPKRIKVRLCRECNESLGRRFEQNAARRLLPLIDGQPVLLSTTEQVRISAWLTKTGLMGALAGSGPGDPDFDLLRMIILEMIETGLPPVQTSVKIGRLTYQEREDEDPEIHSLRLIPNDSGMPEFGFYSLSKSIHLYREVLVGPPSSILRHVDWSRRNSGNHFAQIWPPIEEVAWPPLKRISDAQVWAMRVAFIRARKKKPGLPYPWHRSWGSPRALDF